MKLTFLCAVLGTLLCGAAPLIAQTAQHHLSVDLNAGLGYGWSGGEQTDRVGFATGVLVAWRIATGARATGIVGLDGSWQWQPSGDAICDTGRSGSCIPSYPTFKAVSVVVGGEWSTTVAGPVRVLCGPAAVTGTDESGLRVARAVGVLGMLDGSIPLIQRSAIVAGARYAAVPNFHGRFYAPGAFTFGLRLE
jgi:hypothetical protein